MGAAANNRGSKFISAQLDREQPSAELTILRDLTAYSAAHATRTPLAATVVRFADRSVWLMNRQRRGWGEYGQEYPSLWAVAREWRLVFVSFGRDEHSRFVTVEPVR